jgi:TPR repeat protein
MTIDSISKNYEANTTMRHAPSWSENAARPYLLALSSLKLGVFDAAIYLAHPVAEIGDPASQHILAATYQTLGGLRDYEKALYWYRRAADSGHPKAQVAVDELLSWEKDRIEFYMDRSYRGNPEEREEREERVDRFFQDRIDDWALKDFSRKEFDVVETWYRDRSSSGDPEGEFLYGLMLFTGLFVEKDDARAHATFHKAARQGHLGAKSMIGCLHKYGLGVQRDIMHGRKWFLDAAHGGHAPSQYDVGESYFTGQDAPLDFEKAANWFEKSAMRDYVSAQATLAQLYVMGLGVPRNLVLAHMWSKIAQRHLCGANRLDLVQSSAECERLMTRAQIAEARNRAEEWVPYPGSPIESRPEFDPTQIAWPKSRKVMKRGVQPKNG